MLFDRTLQAAICLLDGVENGQYGGNMTAWNRTPVEQRCLDVAARKMMKTSSLIGTRGAKMTTNSLTKVWKVARETVLCSITW